MNFPATAGSVLMGSERRQATILFADISNPKAASRKDRVRTLGEIVEGRGGRLDRVTETCFAALFGAPKAVGDSSRRAVESALEIRNSLGEFPMRIGIESGEVLSSEADPGRGKEFTITGGAVSLASSLKDIAPNGRILVGFGTWKQTRDFYEFRDIDTLPPAGSEYLGPIHELLGEKTQESGNRMVFSALIGRKRELDLLERQVVKVITGEGGIVNLSGEGGIGKTRLVAELKGRYCMERVSLLEGRAQPFSRGLPYYPVIELLRRWAGIHAGDEEGKALDMLGDRLRSLIPEKAEEMLPFLATLMGIMLDGKLAERMGAITGETLKQLIYKYSRDFIAKFAEKRSVVIIMDDLHLADQSTLDFLPYIFKLVEKSRVLFINIFRPREERCEKIAAEALESYPGKCTDMRLHPLEYAECADLAKNLLKTEALSSRTVESLAVRSGGNPFFIEEIVRNWIDEKAIQAFKGGFHALKPLDTLAVPATIQEAIMARFDRLDEALKDLLRAASVLGRTFQGRTLAGMTGEAESFEARMGLLKELQIMVERGGLAETEYLFKNTLIQETIYDSLLHETRRGLHLRAAQTIQSLFPERLDKTAGMLAWHFARGEDIENTERYMVLAGEAALKSAASNEAFEYFRSALELYKREWGEKAEGKKIAKLEERIAKALFYRGRWAEAIPYYNRIIARYGIRFPRTKPVQYLAAFSGFLSCLTWIKGRSERRLKAFPQEYNEVSSFLLERQTILGMIENVGMVIESFILAGKFSAYKIMGLEVGLVMAAGISWTFSWSGLSFHFAGEILARLKPLVGRDSSHAWIYYLVANGLYCLNSGHWPEIENCLDPSLDKLAEQGKLIEVLSFMLFASCVLLETGQWEKYAEAYVALKRIRERFDTDFGRNCLYLLDLRYRLKTRRIMEARRELPDILKFYETAGLGEDRSAITLSYSARFAALDGDLASAEKFLERLSGEKLAGIKNVFDRGLSRMGAAACAVERMKSPAASKGGGYWIHRTCLSEIRGYLKNAKRFAPDIAEALKFLGSYWWHAGNAKKAMKYWELSLRKAEALGAKVELWHTYADAGALLGDTAPGPEWSEKASALASELGLRRA